MIGITLLFDKSFLQSLTVEESLWLDKFYLSNICPYFFVETLADLDKGENKEEADVEVRKIARKFPEMNGEPNMLHTDLCVYELLGRNISMDGRIICPPAKIFNNQQGVGFYSEASPEADAFLRWQHCQYEEIERNQAKIWRQIVSSFDLDSVAKSFEVFNLNDKKCKNLDECFELSKTIVSSSEHKIEKINLALNFLQVNDETRKRIISRWKSNGYQNLTKCSPYLAFVFNVELFFQIAILNKQISSIRKSNRMDISYLFYLPFVQIFTTYDEQQYKWAKYFIRPNQELIKGKDLKNDLNALNLFYKENISEEESEKGIISLVHHPPLEGDSLTAKLWDKFLPKWRDMDKTDITRDLPDKLEKIPPDKKVFLKQIAKASQNDYNSNIDFDPSQHMHVRQRFIRQRKGSWYQVDKRVPAMEEEE